MSYPNDPYEAEEQAAKMDAERERFEHNNFYCEKCLRWFNRYLPHDCEVRNGK